MTQNSDNEKVIIILLFLLYGALLALGTFFLGVVVCPF